MSSNEKEMLRLDGIHTYYGKSHILQGISLEVRPHECVAILGRNGAGKTTTLKSIMGLTPPRNGGVHFKGRDISRLKPYEISRLGIALVPEDRQIFTTLTVAEAVRKTGRSVNGIWIECSRCFPGWRNGGTTAATS